MKAYIVLNAATVSGAVLGARQAVTPTLPAGAGPKCTSATGQNPGNLAGAASGKQFATGCCTSDADCQTACCGKNTGICQNLGVAVQAAVGGCGGTFGDGAAAPAPAPPSSSTSAAAPADTSAPATGTSPCKGGSDPGSLAGKSTATQFITGCCDSDADCQSTCCGKNTGICQAELVAKGSDAIGGCGGSFTSKKMLFKTF